ncbi:SDR family oxidoreductase [Stappia sp.]|uniref:SDR family NAD(P)-dependent oxidoreductase n=1 Tax=Stappia sp. TaxID=1870903 RepID=UPI0032D8B6D4
MARRLMADGYEVVGVDRVAGETAGASGAGAEAAGDRQHETLRADLTAPDDLARVCAQVAGAPWSVFVHAAGIMRADADTRTWATAGRDLWLLHVGAAAHLAAALTPTMPTGRGRIVLLSSRAARGRAGRQLYAASKAALDGLARSLAADLIDRGITVNVVAPGATDTPMLRDPHRAAPMPPPPPLGRFVAAEEVAATVAFLASIEAGAITGQTLYQCAGAGLASAGRTNGSAAPIREET